MAAGMSLYSTAPCSATDEGAFGANTRLAITCTASGPVCTLAFLGWLDADSVVALETQFDQLAGGEFEEIVVDTRGLRGLDAEGVAALSTSGTRPTAGAPFSAWSEVEPVR